jgi:hypothetical protein
MACDASYWVIGSRTLGITALSVILIVMKTLATKLKIRHLYLGDTPLNQIHE